MPFRTPTTTSAYQERTAMTFRARLSAFKDWLSSQGADVYSLAGPFEVLRYKAWTAGQPDSAKKPATHIVYRKADGRVSFTGDSFEHFNRFTAGQKLDNQDRASPAKRTEAAPKRATAKQHKPKMSWTKRTRALLHQRDGDDCWFCCQPLTYMNDEKLRGGETIEHLIAQSLAEELGMSRADINHMDNLVLAHARCNRDAGHKTVAEKEAIRAMHKEGLRSIWNPKPRKRPIPCG